MYIFAFECADLPCLAPQRVNEVCVYGGGKYQSFNSPRSLQSESEGLGTMGVVSQWPQVLSVHSCAHKQQLEMRA